MSRRDGVSSLIVSCNGRADCKDGFQVRLLASSDDHRRQRRPASNIQSGRSRCGHVMNDITASRAVAPLPSCPHHDAVVPALGKGRPIYVTSPRKTIAIYYSYIASTILRRTYKFSISRFRSAISSGPRLVDNVISYRWEPITVMSYA